MLTNNFINFNLIEKHPNMGPFDKVVIEKCNITGRNVGLCVDNSIAYQTFELVQNTLIHKHGNSPDYLECYRKFLDIYSM